MHVLLPEIVLYRGKRLCANSGTGLADSGRETVACPTELILSEHIDM